MTVVMARIDNRLLHGIIVTQWAPISSANRVMVIDNEIASDDIAKASMRLARPVHMAVSIICEQTALNNFTNGQYNREKVFVIVKKPDIILHLINNGIKIHSLTIGSTIIRKDAVRLSSRVFATKEELEIYQKLAQKGVAISVQYVPADKPKDITAKIKDERL